MLTANRTLEDYAPERGVKPHGRVTDRCFFAPTSPKAQELKQRFEARHAAINSRIATGQNEYIKEDQGCSNCRMRLIGGTHLVECHEDEKWCRWELYFGNTRFCTHPTAGQLAEPPKQSVA